MPEHFGEVGYTPPVGRYGTTDPQHDAYMAAHSAGWTHANFVAAYGDNGESVTTVAVRWATDQGYEPDSRVYLRAVEGFTAGADAFDESVNGD